MNIAKEQAKAELIYALLRQAEAVLNEEAILEAEWLNEGAIYEIGKNLRYLQAQVQNRMMNI